MLPGPFKSHISLLKKKLALFFTISPQTTGFIVQGPTRVKMFYHFIKN